MSFKTSVVTIAIVLGVAILAMVGFFLYSEKSNKEISQTVQSADSESKVVSDIGSSSLGLGDVYTSKNQWVSFRPPLAWEVSENDVKNLFITMRNRKPDQFELKYLHITGINITSAPFTGSFEQFVFHGKENMAAMENVAFKILTEDLKEINGIQAKIIESHDSNKYAVHALSVFLLKDGLGYTIFAVTPEESWAQYRKAILGSVDSFTVILDSKKATALVAERKEEVKRQQEECNKIREAIDENFLKNYNKTTTSADIKLRLRAFGFLDKNDNLISMDVVIQNCLAKIQ